MVYRKFIRLYLDPQLNHHLRRVLGLLDVGLLPLVVEVDQLRLEGPGEGDDGGAGVVGVHELLDLWQPEMEQEFNG